MSSSSSSGAVAIKAAASVAVAATTLLGAYFLGSRAAEKKRQDLESKSADLETKFADVGATHSRAVLPSGEGEVAMYPIPHVKDDWSGTLETFESPLVARKWPVNKNFVSSGEYILSSQPFVVEPSALVEQGDSRERILRHQVVHHHHSHSAASMDSGGREGGLALAASQGAVPATPTVGTGASPTDASPRPSERPLPVAFAAAGPRPIIYHNPKTTKIAICTAGGLAPGLNVVVREIVMAATYVYGVPVGNVFGIPGGYKGFYEDPGKWIALTPEKCSHFHTMGGTVLGSSRGGFDADKILDAMIGQGITMAIICGGDGTHRGIAQLQAVAKKRGVKVAIAGVPKTVDNDISIIDRSFGFQTAVDEAIAPLTAGHTEALAATNGIGLIQLMGRNAGFIALYASLASRDVNVCLIPEASWQLGKVCEFLEDRLSKRGHALIVVAEGAESEERKAEKEAAKARAKAEGKEVEVLRDPSGNPILEDVGEYLKAGILGHFKRKGLVCNLKLINPSYIIRAAPANAADSDLCASLAFNCVHGLFAGHTAFTVGTVDNNSVWLPVDLVANSPPRRVDITSRIYARLISSTGQPSFM